MRVHIGQICAICVKCEGCHAPSSCNWNGGNPVGPLPDCYPALSKEKGSDWANLEKKRLTDARANLPLPRYMEEQAEQTNSRKPYMGEYMEEQAKAREKERQRREEYMNEHKKEWERQKSRFKGTRFQSAEELAKEWETNAKAWEQHWTNYASHHQRAESAPGYDQRHTGRGGHDSWSKNFWESHWKNWESEREQREYHAQGHAGRAGHDRSHRYDERWTQYRSSSKLDSDDDLPAKDDSASEPDSDDHLPKASHGGFPKGSSRRSGSHRDRRDDRHPRPEQARPKNDGARRSGRHSHKHQSSHRGNDREGASHAKPRREAKKPNYYQILEVSEKATVEECVKAARKRLMKVHPDKHPEDRNDPVKSKYWTDEAAKVTEAQEILGDATKKALYDEKLRFGIF